MELSERTRKHWGNPVVGPYPRPYLPTEILDHILDFVIGDIVSGYPDRDQFATLCACILVHPRWHDIATPFLYRRIIIHNARLLRGLRKTLVSNPRLTSHVKEALIDGTASRYYGQEWLLHLPYISRKLPRLTIRDLQWTFLHPNCFKAGRQLIYLTELFITNLRIGSVAELARLISCFPSLHTLDIRRHTIAQQFSVVPTYGRRALRKFCLWHDGAGGYSKEAEHTFRGWLSRSGILRSLETLVIFFDGHQRALGFSQGYSDIYALLHSCTSLKKLFVHLYTREIEDEDEDPFFPFLEDLTGILSTVTELTICLPHVYLEPGFNFNNFMQWPCHDLAVVYHFISSIEPSSLTLIRFRVFVYMADEQDYDYDNVEDDYSYTDEFDAVVDDFEDSGLYDFDSGAEHSDDSKEAHYMDLLDEGDAYSLHDPNYEDNIDDITYLSDRDDELYQDDQAHSDDLWNEIEAEDFDHSEGEAGVTLHPIVNLDGQLDEMMFPALRTVILEIMTPGFRDVVAPPMNLSVFPNLHRRGVDFKIEWGYKKK